MTRVSVIRVATIMVLTTVAAVTGFSGVATPNCSSPLGSPLLCTAPASNLAFAFDEDEGPAYVAITRKPKVSKKGNGWLVEFGAKGINLPSGLKVRVLFTWRSQVIHTETVTLSGGPVDAKAQLESAPVSQEPILLRTEIHREDQPSSVAKALEKNEKHFPPAAHPWTTIHWDESFPLATPEEIAAELAWCREFFKSRYTQLGLLDRKVRSGSQAASKGEDFVKDETLDTKKWRKMMDDEVIAAIVKVQGELEESFKTPRLMPYRRELRDLVEIANGVAYRVTRESAAVYRSFDLEPVPEDLKPEKLVTKTRQRPPIRSRYLGNLIQSINARLGIGGEPDDDDSEDSRSSGTP